jgi:EmrB/QacA subfamily drug resistance transporter
MAWVVSAYLIASTVFTPLYGRFSDLYGRRIVLSFAIVLFGLATAACALAQTMPQLVAARVLQGAGGGGLLAMAQALLADVVPVRERGRYQSQISVVWACAGIGGPVVGGALTQFLDWPWIFWLNLPVALLALVLTWRALRRLPVAHRRPRIDWAGMALLIVGLTALLLPIARVGQGVAWHEGANLGGVALAVAVLVLFVRHQLRTAHPILPLQLFANRPVLLGCGLQFMCFFLFMAVSVLVPLRLQLVGGLSVGRTALQLLPLTLGIPAAAFFSGRWMSRTGRVRLLQWAGVALVPPGLLALALLPPDQHLASGLTLVLLGFGMGLQMPTTLVALQNAVAPALIGTATGLAAFFRLLGGAVGVAVLNAITLTLLRDALPPQALAHGLESLAQLMATASSGSGLAGADGAFRTVLLISAGLSLLAVPLALGLPDVQLHGGPAAAAVE